MSAADDIIAALPEGRRKPLLALFSRYHFTESQKLEAAKAEADLRQWKETPYTEIAPYSDIDRRGDGRKGDAYIIGLRKHMHSLRSCETDYSAFMPAAHPRPKYRIATIDKPAILGKCPCPVDGEKTRCCKLTTLDAVEQCAFSCSYCSVQAFYAENEIRAVGNLKEKLLSLTIPDGIWHIGTGQASDSLLLGDDYGTLSALSAFASAHPDIVIELKSKSGRDVFSTPYPPNMIFTWSLNAPTIIEKEEHLTASLGKRLESAMRARDNGSLVGFHIHPMVYFKGWDEEYPRIAEEIAKRFSPSDICMISMGTLTFTKHMLRTLRERGEESKVLEMELTPAAGKFSYPLDVKERMFGTMHRSFPEEYRKSVFFYLCMENPSLWHPVLGRGYSSDKDFEMDMKKHYLKRIEERRKP